MIDLAPLVVFFVGYMLGGLYWATGALMAATVVSLIAARIVLGHVSPVLASTAVLVLGFGALTIWLQDPRFIKIKPTIVYLLFAAVLLGGLLLGRSLIQLLLGEALKLTDEGWRVLTLRWGLFFIAMALLNEVVWRNFSETFWASFKLFGFPPMTVVFAAAQLFAVQKKHALVADASQNSSN